MPRCIPQEIAYPESLAAVEELLVRYAGKRIQYLAGGTDLVLDINERQFAPCDLLIYLDRIQELKKIRCADGKLSLGSCVSHKMLAESPVVQKAFPALCQAAEGVGSPPIRVMGTIGGNIARSSPAGDVSTALLLTDATIHILGPSGRREVSCHEFHIGPRKNVLESGELITHLTMEIPASPCGSAFEKLGGRKTMFIASVSCGALLLLNPMDGTIDEARLCQGSIAPTPVRVPEAEAFLMGKEPSPEVLATAAELAKERAHPRTSQRGTSAYRKEMAGVLTLRCLRRALINAKEAS